MGCPGGRPFFVSQEIAGGESGLRKTALLKKSAGKGRQKKIRGKCLNICAYYVILMIQGSEAKYLLASTSFGKQKRAVDRLSEEPGQS